MNHNEFIREIDGADTAVLMIHGIFGTPRHFDDIVNIVPQSWSVYNILLDGHGMGVKEFGSTSMEKWKHQVDEIMSVLNKKYKHIYLVGHSMGTLLSLDISHKYENKIRKMILLAVPLRIFLKPISALNSFKLIFGLNSTENPMDEASKRAHSVQHNEWFWHYAGWVPRYIELFKLIYKVRNEIESVSVPAVTFQSKKDEMVAFNSIKYLQKNKKFTNFVLNNSMHYYYDEQDYKFMLNKIKEEL